MQKRNLDNKTLDMIGRKLVERGSRRSGDVENIISAPDLFAAVKKRIAVTEASPFALPFFRRNATAFAGVALILVVVVIGATSLLRSEKTFVAVNDIQVPDAIPENARPEVPPNPFVGKLSAGRAFVKETQKETGVTKAVLKKTVRKRQTNTNHEPAGDFYALSTGYDQDETAGGGRIIRVDMPRSSLFALGVNIPLENDAEIVKADLLIGSEGMTHAIRVVK